MEIVRYNGEEWAALYVDGKLVAVGDSYHADEHLATLLKVDERDGYNTLLRQGVSYEDIPQTLTEAEAAVAAIEAKYAEAEALKARAAELIAEANALVEASNV